MFSSFDWQQAMGERQDAVSHRLSSALPLVALSIPNGLLFATLRRQAPKVFEVYDRLILGAIGQQADIESLRLAAIDFSHQEGFNRSEQDVTIQRVVQALSGPMKRNFGDLNTLPLIGRFIFGQVGETPSEDVLYTLHADGEYEQGRAPAVLAATESEQQFLINKLDGGQDLRDDASALASLKAIFEEWLQTKEEGDQIRLETSLQAVILSRSDAKENRFIHLS